MRENFYNGISLGPLLYEDAEFLKAIINMTTPKVLVEFGFFWGDSAKAMLSVMRRDAELHSFDNTKGGDGIDDPRFHFYNLSQDEIKDIKDIDFVFLDGSHDLEINKRTFAYLKDNMSPKGIIAVHDTGAWVGGNVFNSSIGELNENGEWVHRPEEVAFVTWLQEAYSNWQQIHFHSNKEVRHGITLLQNRVVL